MRLWSKQLISVLPREQLVGSWRELSAIAGNIQSKGTPNHLLVNKVMEYNYDHFISYAALIRAEMTRRGYKTMNKVWDKIVALKPNYMQLNIEEIYSEWHNERYLRQCYYNLQEKYDCGGIEQSEYYKLIYTVQSYIPIDESYDWLK